MHLDTDNLSALQAVIGDQVKDLLQIYLDSAPTYITQMTTALDTLDLSSLQYAAHTLKGSAANIGASQLADLCQQLEEFAKNQQSCALPSLIEQIIHESSAVQHAIDDFIASH